MKKIRIGYGYDVHKLEYDIPLWLGGVNIPYYKGFLAHSDGDVLIHAICDALLGALNLGDIGTHFPDTDDDLKNADSKVILARCVRMVHDKGFVIGNIDTTVTLEKPRILKYSDQMRRTLAPILDVDPEDISIKATTNEEMGYVGREQGGEATAVALLFHRDLLDSMTE